MLVSVREIDNVVAPNPPVRVFEYPEESKMIAAPVPDEVPFPTTASELGTVTWLNTKVSIAGSYTRLLSVSTNTSQPVFQSTPLAVGTTMALAPRFNASPRAALIEETKVFAVEVSSALRRYDIRLGVAITSKIVPIAIVTISSISVKPRQIPDLRLKASTV